MQSGADVCAALTRLQTDFQYVDLFDESDALLWHKYQLIYAVGSPMKLLAGPERWYMVQVMTPRPNATKEHQHSRAQHGHGHGHVSVGKTRNLERVRVRHIKTSEYPCP
jgi:hypothetical protein